MKETIVVTKDGKTVHGEVSISHRIEVEIDCGCWGHRKPWPATIIVTELASKAYVRCGTEDGFFKDRDGVGPIFLHVIASKKVSDNG